jgi:hypothetical protein
MSGMDRCTAIRLMETIKVAIGSLYEASARPSSVSTVGLGAKFVEQRAAATRIDFENGSAAIRIFGAGLMPPPLLWFRKTIDPPPESQTMAKQPPQSCRAL